MTTTAALAPSRRQALSLGFGAVGALVLSGPVLNGSTAPTYAGIGAQELIAQFTGGRRSVQGKVKLDLPDIAENGNAVRITVWVESPMTERSHVTDVLLVADGNPHAGVATFHFSPASGVAQVKTRIRLNSTQSVIAVAKMNDGSFYMSRKQVKVALGGCCS